MHHYCHWVHHHHQTRLLSQFEGENPKNNRKVAHANSIISQRQQRLERETGCKEKKESEGKEKTEIKTKREKRFTLPDSRE